MRRLTLVLSDLYLPEENPAADRPPMQALPGLESLLRVAEWESVRPDWRHWLLARHGGSLAHQSLAELCADSFGLPAEGTWLATPVHLEARLDHVRMSDRGLLSLSRDESARCCAEFNRVFGPEMTLHACGERAFLLTGLMSPPATTHDPARCLGAEIGTHLPAAESREIRRVWAEIEMWLHGAPVNEGRDRARQRRISALWLWGREPPMPPAPMPQPQSAAFFGRDPLCESLARRSGMPSRAMSGLEEWLADTTAETAVVEIAPISGADTLASLDPQWFMPARDALDRGRLAELTVIANDRVFRIGRRARWKFWRRRRHWLDLLAAKA